MLAMQPNVMVMQLWTLSEEQKSLWGLTALFAAQLNEELKQNLRETMVQKYKQENEKHITKAVDKLQQEVRE